MPELPEVESIRRQLDPRLRGARIIGSWTFGTPKFEAAPAAVGRRITGVARRGKYLLIGLADTGMSPAADSELVVHLGMTGRLAVTGPAAGAPVTGDRALPVSAEWDRAALITPPTDQHLRALWQLDDGRTLRFDDVRRFGRVAVVPAGDHRNVATLAALGPEPFDPEFSPDHLRHCVNGSRRALKTQLLGQRVVAGVGNIYADEALWLARVHPASRRLTVAAAGELHASLLTVLRQGIENGGTTLRDYRDATGATGYNQHHLECYGRAGAPCSRCETELRHMVIDARSTTFCPMCQRRIR